ncbi:hypothetical protein [Roseibium sp. FZY0029]|uniref:hypothetical protein n=1 Tax=Roseibium sp. FZY0029 TaxID=3116647 RepID=UPI002ED02082
MMTKISTQRKWSNGRQKKNFRRKSETKTLKLLETVSQGSIHPHEIGVDLEELARDIAHQIANIYSSKEFAEKIRSYPKDVDPKKIDNIPAIIEHIEAHFELENADN